MKKVVFDEARPAHTFPRLSAETFLPAVMVPDARPPRGQHEEVRIEDIPALVAKADAKSGAA